MPPNGLRDELRLSERSVSMQLLERNHELKPERVATRSVLDQQVLFLLEGHAAGLADRQCDLCAKVEGATAIANAGGAVGVDGH